MSSQEAKRLELWATPTGSLLHATPTCCPGYHRQRRQVKDHYDPTYFNDPRFKLCYEALREGDSDGR